MLFTMFFFFRDGDTLIAFMKRLTPLKSDQVTLVYSHLRQVIEGMMYGGVVIALIQGVLGGVLFAIMGIPSAVLWGSLMALLAFIPILGPFLVYIPAGVILILGGSYIKGILLILIGTVVISQIDNFLRPLLFSGKTQTHTLMLFFSIMGGIAMFSLLGIVLGPFIAAVFLSLLKSFELQLHPEIGPSLAEQLSADLSDSNNAE
jgi:predicted PurR-regulated permease PerM